MGRKSREKKEKREHQAHLDAMTPRQRVLHQIVISIDRCCNDETGLDEFYWVKGAGKLEDEFEDAVDYDAFRCSILRQYAFCLGSGVEDIDAVSWDYYKGIDEKCDWLKADQDLRARYVEQAEREHKVLASGKELEELFVLAQEAEIKDLLPKFDEVINRLAQEES